MQGLHCNQRAHWRSLLHSGYAIEKTRVVTRTTDFSMFCTKSIPAGAPPISPGAFMSKLSG